MFIGAHGALHQDSFHSAFWQYVVTGTKEWAIVDYVGEQHDFFAPDAVARKAPVTTWFDEVRAGELVFITHYTWHQVRNVRGHALSYAGNFISRQNVDAVRKMVNAHMGCCC